MTDSCELLPRPMLASDWPMVEAAFAHSFRDARTREVWEWRFQRQANRWLGQVVMSPDGRVAAFVGGSIQRGWAYGRDTQIVLGADAFSHPLWRGKLGGRRGLFARTDRAFLDACGDVGLVCLGFANERRLILGEKLGINKAYHGGNWYLLAFSVQPISEGCACLVQPADFSAPIWDEVWLRRRERVKFSLKRDAEFLAWRFDDRQGRTYWRFAINSIASSIPMGYIVLTPVSGGRAILVDAVLEGGPQVIRDAMRQVAAWLYSRGIREVLTFTGAGCPEHCLWQQFGFVPCPPPLASAPAYWLTRMASDISEEMFERDYAFTLADGDVF